MENNTCPDRNEINKNHNNKNHNNKNRNTRTIDNGVAKHRRTTGRLGAAALVLASLIGAGAAVVPATAFADTSATAAAASPSAGEPLTIEELATLNSELDQLNAELAGPGASTASWNVIASLGTSLGEKVFSSVLDLGLDALLDELGLGDGTAQALKDIQSSIDNVQASVDRNTELLKEVLDETKWSTFKTAENHVQESAGLIRKTTAAIAQFEEKGLVPTAKDVELLWEATDAAIATIESQVTGAAGTMAFLQDAVGSQDPEQAWTTIELYRSHYRNVLAQGLVNLTWLMQYDDVTDLTLEVYYDVAVDSAERAVDAMYYDVGAAYQNPLMFVGHPLGWPTPTPPAAFGASIHLTNTKPGTLYASAARPVAVGEQPVPVRTGDAARTMYAELQAEFEAGRKHGMTFEQYLAVNGIPTTVVHANTIEVVKPVIMGGGAAYWLEGYVKWNQTTVVGDTIKTESKTETFKGNNQSKLEAEMEARRSALYEAAQFHSPYKLAVEANAAGLAISSDPHAVEMARTGFHVEVGEATRTDDIGTLTVENLGDYDTLYFIDATTGQSLGSADISSGSVEHATFLRPPSGEVRIVIGHDVPDAGMVMVPVASTIVEAGDATPNSTGEVMFSTITTVDSLS